MQFITQQDLKIFLTEKMLNDIISDDLSLLDSAELVSISEISSFLSGKFDLELMLNDTNRNRLLVLLIVDIMMYYLYKRIYADVPKNILDTYNAKIKYLQEVASSKYCPVGFIQKDERFEDKNVIQYGDINYNTKNAY